MAWMWFDYVPQSFMYWKLVPQCSNVGGDGTLKGWGLGGGVISDPSLPLSSRFEM
jgi:hypothetical protein